MAGRNERDLIMKFERKSIIVICAVILAAVVVLAGYMIFTGNCRRDKLLCSRSPEQPLPQDWPATVADPRKQTPQEAMEFVKSDDFARLSAEQKQYYMRSTRKKVMRYQVEKFHSLAAEEKQAFLDEVIDSFGQWRQGRQIPDGVSPAEPLGVRTEPPSPQRRKQFAEFREALRMRMLQRGIEPGRPKF